MTYLSEFAEFQDPNLENAAAFKIFVDAFLKSPNSEKVRKVALTKAMQEYSNETELAPAWQYKKILHYRDATEMLNRNIFGDAQQPD